MKRKSALKGQGLGLSKSESKLKNPRPTVARKIVEPPQISPFARREQILAKKRRPNNVLRQIKLLQSKPDLLLPRAPFNRLVREVCQEQIQGHFRWTSLSLEALQTSAEEYLVGLFQDSYLCSAHCKRVTLLAKDLQLARRIRGVCDPGNR